MKVFKVKKRTKYLVIAIVLSVCSVAAPCLSTKASAATKSKEYVYYKGKHHLKGGVGKKSKQCFWVSSGLGGFMYNCAKDAMLDWTNNASFINFKITSSRPSSTVDIYGEHSGKNASFNAYTVFRNGTFSYANPDKENWKYGQIYYNLDNGIKQKNRNRIIGVFAHEIGHCFGLDENNGNIFSIMCQYGSGRAVTNVRGCDFKGVKNLYK